MSLHSGLALFALPAASISHGEIVNMTKVTNGDRRMIVYFQRDKGDITRWSFWKERLPAIEAEYPELIKALRDCEMAERILDLVLDKIERDDDGSDDE